MVSKIFEKVAHKQVKVAHKQVYEYFDTNKILYMNQSGFRQGFSTETALIGLTDNIRLNFDQGNLTGMILLDLQKAFDTVDHEILLKKLSAAGLSIPATSWFGSYLKDRNQFVELNNTKSDLNPVTCGVPQGSILGPLLFLLYVNDMTSSVEKCCNLYLYADDSGLSVSGKNVKEIENIKL